MGDVSVGDITGITLVLVAVFGVAIAYREWRHKTDHWLYIPAPKPEQSPLDPEFWVFPPVPIEDGVAVPIRGKIVNAGPSDAFSVHIYAEPELPWDEAKEVLAVTASYAVSSKATSVDRSSAEAFGQLLGVYRSKSDFVPVLKAGDELPFVVVAKYEATDPYISALPRQAGVHTTARWTHDGSQAHLVHASSRTATRLTKSFGPNQLCAPFEEDAPTQRSDRKP